MCGRYTLTEDDWQEYHRQYSEMLNMATTWEYLEPVRPYMSNFNVAPSQIMPVLTNRNGYAFEFMRWGLIPPWNEQFKMTGKTVNARNDTLLESKLWNRLVGTGTTKRYGKEVERMPQHCVIPLTGYYEFDTENPKDKHTYYYYMKDRKPFSAAGLFDIWLDAEKKPFYTYTMITAEPNSVVEEKHDRMPAILTPEEVKLWLDPDITPQEAVGLIRTYPAELMTYHEVSTRVNSWTHNDEKLIEKIEKTTLF